MTESFKVKQSRVERCIGRSKNSFVLFVSVLSCSISSTLFTSSFCGSFGNGL